MQYQPPESNAIRRLTACTCILAVAAVVTALAFFLMQGSQERRIVRASELAEDGLARLVDDRRTLSASNIAVSEKEFIVCPGGGERYSREVTIDPGDGQAGPMRITVTVAWETITGESRVRMHRRLDAAGRAGAGDGSGE